jgi:hypothetical protein
VAPRVRVAFRGVTYTLVRDSLIVATGSLVMSVAVPGLGTVKFFLNAYVHPSVPVINGALTSSLALLETWDNMWAGSEAAFAAATPGAPVRFAVPRDATDKFVFQMMWRLSEWGGVLWRVGEFGLLRVPLCHASSIDTQCTQSLAFGLNTHPFGCFPRSLPTPLPNSPRHPAGTPGAADAGLPPLYSKTRDMLGVDDADTLNYA